jgi:hypothetical protein
MKTTSHWQRVRVALFVGLVVALTSRSVIAEEEGAAGAVKGGMDKAADSTKRGLTKAGEAVGEALDTAISKTGKGVSHVLEKTGTGIQKAGRAISGDPPPATEAGPAPDPVPQHPIQEEPLDE